MALPHLVLKKGYDIMGKKDEEIERQRARADELGNTNTMLVAKCKSLKNKIQEITDHRQLMVVNVNITGVQDIDKCLNDAVSLVVKRLTEGGKQDDYFVLAVPHTTAIDIPR